MPNRQASIFKLDATSKKPADSSAGTHLRLTKLDSQPKSDILDLSI